MCSWCIWNSGSEVFHVKYNIVPILENLISKSGLPQITETQLAAFQTYYELLIEWNERMNLTAITEPEAVCEKHFIDSLLLQQAIPKKEGLNIIDVGSGAGFPGIPLAIVLPQHRFYCIDALQKRVTFLDHLIQTLHLQNVEAIHARSEILARENGQRDHYDCGVARAVARLPLLLEYVMPFIKTDGVLIASKGSDAENETKESANALKELQTTYEQTINTSLPNGDERNILILRKTAPTPETYPRRPGAAKKKPL